ETVDPQLRKESEKGVDLVQVGFFEDGGVGANQEVGLLGGANPLHGRLKYSRPLDGAIVRVFQAVQMDIEKELARRAEFRQLFLDEHAIGAQVNMLASLEDAAHEPANLRVDNRLAAADRKSGGEVQRDHRGGVRNVQVNNLRSIN